MKELAIANDCLIAGNMVVLAVVAKTWGSAPRRAGSLMVVREDGSFEGSVSGGCVEGTVISEAQAMLANTSPDTSKKTLKFSVATETAWEVGLACGGDITIWLFRLISIHQAAVAAAARSIANGQSGLLSINAHDAAWQESALKPNQQRPFEEDNTAILPVPAPVSLRIVGAVHIAQHLAAMARECGWDVAVIDPREAFTDNRAFAGAALVTDLARWTISSQATGARNRNCYPNP